MKKIIIRLLLLIAAGALLAAAWQLYRESEIRNDKMFQEVSGRLDRLSADLEEAEESWTETPMPAEEAFETMSENAGLQAVSEGSLIETEMESGAGALSEAGSEEEMTEPLIEEMTEPLIEEMSEAEGTEAVYETETESETEPPIPIPVNHHVIFVGDSRTVGMGRAEAHQKDFCTYIGESGEGYNWLIDYGIDLMDAAIRQWPGAPVVYNFGVNDCSQINAYLEVYHALERGYPDTEFYYMSVNPVTEESPHVPLTDVLAFNRKLKAEFPDQYIDTCSWMLKAGYEDVDGVHYSEKQYCAIHDFAVRAILKMKEEAETEERSIP